MLYSHTHMATVGVKWLTLWSLHLSDPFSSRALCKLDWFRLTMLTHNALCSAQPAYLHSLLNYHTPTRSLRSANTNLLSVPCVHTTFASRGFSVAVWNSLPSDIRHSSSSHTFCRLLKTHSFQQAFGSPSGSPMCLRFEHRLISCTLKIHLFTYWLIDGWIKWWVDKLTDWLDFIDIHELIGSVHLSLRRKDNTKVNTFSKNK